MVKARQKILPGLGGIRKKYLSKYNLIEPILRFLAEKIGDIDENNLKQKDRKILREIKNDLENISKFKSLKVIQLYYLCQNILNKY